MSEKADGRVDSDLCDQLGPLPEPYTRQWINAPFTERLLFTEDQLRACALQERYAERERCAKLLIAEAKRLAGRGDYGQGYLVHQINMLERLADEVRATTAAPPQRQPLPPASLDGVMALHFGANELTDDEADSARKFARAVERAHGIGPNVEVQRRP